MRRTLALLAALFLIVSIVTPASAGKPPKPDPVRHTGTDYNNGQALPLAAGDKPNGQAPNGPAKVGQTRTWLGLDDFRGVVTLKNYTLRGVGQHIEVWVANNLMFPNQNMLNPLTADPTDFFTYNDCRNDGVRNVVTDAQVQYLIGQFDNVMLPVETTWWGAAPQRDGKHSTLTQAFKGQHGRFGLNLPDSNYNGEGDNVVVLVDNVRDDNFYDQDNQGNNPFIAGFYFSVFDDYFDRTVMSIDAFDWLHRMQADPPHNPTNSLCTSAPARPFLYESVFAHEYQHLIHHYSDPNEISWVNEGLSDFTEVLTGYANLSKHVDEKGWESHTQNFLGWASVGHPDWNPIPRASGPENGLTAWEDQGDDEVLTDYGFAMFFMNYINSQGFGQAFFNAWHHNAANGIDGLNAALAAAGSSETFQSLFADAIVSALVDGYIDNGAGVAGANADDLKNNATEATILISPQANDKPGAPPWGSDYIDLGAGASLASLEFDGEDHYPGGPNWVVDGDGYFTNPDVLGSNYGDNQDLSIARAVPGAGTLSFDHYYAMELGWDFGFVQVSTDGGATWSSLECDGTTSDHNPDAIQTIVDNVPGYTGPSDNPEITDTNGTAEEPLQATCTLPAGSDYVSFRLMTDPAAEFDGWHVKNVQVNGLDLGTPESLAGWDNQLFFTPTDLGYMLTLVGINGTVDGFGDVGASTGVAVVHATVDADDEYSLTPADQAALAGYARVVAIVTGIPVSESVALYQPYSLVVNGTERADGQ